MLVWLTLHRPISKTILGVEFRITGHIVFELLRPVLSSGQHASVDQIRGHGLSIPVCNYIWSLFGSVELVYCARVGNTKTQVYSLLPLLRTQQHSDCHHKLCNHLLVQPRWTDNHDSVFDCAINLVSRLYLLLLGKLSKQFEFILILSVLAGDTWKRDPRDCERNPLHQAKAHQMRRPRRFEFVVGIGGQRGE